MRGPPQAQQPAARQDMNEQETKRSMNRWSFYAVIFATGSPVT